MDYRILDTPQAIMTGGCVNLRISQDISDELYFSDFSCGRIPRLRYHWHWHWQWSRTFTMLTVHHTAVPTEPNKSFKISPLYFQECAVVLTTDVWHNWHRGVILKHDLNCNFTEFTKCTKFVIFTISFGPWEAKSLTAFSCKVCVIL